MAESLKRTFIHSYTENIKALGLEVLEKKNVLCFSQYKSLGANKPRGGSIWTAGAWLAGFIKRTPIHCYTQNMKALGLVVSEILLCFSNDAPMAWPVWIPGPRLAGFIKRTTIHCYTQNMKALGLVVSEKKILLCFSHCKSMGANDSQGGTIFDHRGMVGRIYKEGLYTMLHTKYESSGPCGFGEDFCMFFQ